MRRADLYFLLKTSGVATSSSPTPGPMRVVVSPVLVGERLCRIVAPIESLLEVEEWAGAWWEPSNVTLTETSLATTASVEVLRAHFVPEDDWYASDARPDDHQIQAQMYTRDPDRSEQTKFDDKVVRRLESRRRKYPGNSRFRRGPGVQDSTFEGERRREDPTEWNGPWRRSTDVRPDSTGAP